MRSSLEYWKELFQHILCISTSISLFTWVPLSGISTLKLCLATFKALLAAAAAANSLQPDSLQPHRWQPTRLPRPWDSPGKNSGVGCRFLRQCMKVKSQSEVAQSCPTLNYPMDCSLPGSSIHGIFQASVLEWGATAFSSKALLRCYLIHDLSAFPCLFKASRIPCTSALIVQTFGLGVWSMTKQYFGTNT